MKRVYAPCYKCEDRVLGCHATCERYKEYAGVVAENRVERYENSMKKSKLVSSKREKERAKRQGEK